MREPTNMLAARCGIYLLADDRTQRCKPASEGFDEAPFRSFSRSPVLPARPRLLDDADGWATWRQHRAELELSLVAHEACRHVDPENADRVRDRLAEIERRVCDSRVEDILSELSLLQREVQDESAAFDA